jgi:hypothetical protein
MDTDTDAGAPYVFEARVAHFETMVPPIIFCVDKCLPEIPNFWKIVDVEHFLSTD